MPKVKTPTTGALGDPQLEARVTAIKDALRQAIRMSPLTEREVGRRLGYGRSFLSNLFNDTRGRGPGNLRIDVLLAILDLLGLHAGAFLTEVELKHSTALAMRRAMEETPRPDALPMPVPEAPGAAVAGPPGSLTEVQGLMEAALRLLGEVNRVTEAQQASPPKAARGEPS